MEEMALEIFILLLTVIVVLVVTFIYCERPDLHNCGSCGKFLNIKVPRYWYKVCEKEVPFCKTCNRKHSKPYL